MQKNGLNDKADVPNHRSRRMNKCFGLAAFLTMFLWALGAEAVAGPATIGSCQPIDKPGSYELSNNLEAKAGDCIVVNADFVTIDMKGFTLFGSGTGAGIRQGGEV